MTRDVHTISILHLISSFTVGGIEKMLVYFLKNVSPEDLDVKYTVVVMNDAVDEGLKAELLATGHNVYFLNRRKADKHPKYVFELLNIIRKHNIDIVHTHNFGSKFWGMLCKAIVPKLKLVFCFSDTNIANRYSLFHSYVHNLFIDSNICISKTITKECADAGLERLEHIYYGINTDKFAKPKVPITGKALSIVNIARVTHSKKGQDILIKALKICSDAGMDFKCSFVGAIYHQNSYEYLSSLVSELGLERQIEFLGNRADIDSILEQSDLFVLPSRYEGLGLVVLEAMAAGVPVIASNIDGPAELITHDKNGLLFESANEKDLAQKILNLYKNPEKMQKLANGGQQFVKNLDILTMCSNYHTLYSSLLDESKNVLMIGSDVSVKGGMSTIINLYEGQGIFEDNIAFIPSHIEGAVILKTLFFAKFLFKFLYILLFSSSIKIIHVHSSYRGSFFRKAIILHLAKAFRKKTVFHLNGSKFNVFYEESAPAVKAFITHTLNITDLVLVVSRQWGNDILAKKVTSKIKVLYNPVTLPDTCIKRDDNIVNILFMGKIGHRKGAYDVVEAAKLIDNDKVKINMYGDGETKKLQSLVKKAGLKHIINVEDWISGDKVQEAFQKADIYILPSYNEGLPLSVLEAISYGLPVISTKVGGTPEAVIDGINGYLIEPGDYKLLAEKISILASDKSLRTRMGQASREIANTKFNANMIVDQLNGYYEELTTTG